MRMFINWFSHAVFFGCGAASVVLVFWLFGPAAPEQDIDLEKGMAPYKVSHGREARQVTNGPAYPKSHAIERLDQAKPMPQRSDDDDESHELDRSRGIFRSRAASVAVAFWLVMPSALNYHPHPHDAAPGRASGPSFEESLRQLSENNGVKVEDQIDVEPPGKIPVDRR